MKILAPFLLLLGMLPLLNCVSVEYRYEQPIRTRLRREVPYVRTVRRASLHELLKMNGNVASVSENSEGRRPVDDLQSTSDNNDNRRVLVVGDADEPPNYIDDDRVTSDKKINDYDTITNDKDKPSGEPAKKTKIGTTMTKFSPSNAPSYADPELLTAVMKQADKANFRFPSQYKRDPTASPVLKRSPEVDSTQNDENPYKTLFPSQFHELFDIPMHIHRNGSAKLNTSKTTKPKLQAPRITGGYSNTNINNPSYAKPEQENGEKDVTGERHANYKQAVQRPIPTTIVRQQNTQNGIRQKPNYTEVVRKTNGVEDRIPSTDPSRLPEKKLERPSLQFRTKAPALVIHTDNPDYRENVYYTESTTLGFVPNSEEVNNSITTPNRYYVQEAIRVTPLPLLSSQSNLKTIKGDPGFQSDIMFDNLGFGSKISVDFVKSEEQVYKPVEIVRQKISSKPADVIHRMNPSNRLVETIQKIQPVTKQSSNPPIYNRPVYNSPTYNLQSNDREISKLPFKPSKADPYLSSGITIALPFDHPTTFKPEYHPYGNGQPNVVYQRNTAYNNYNNQDKQTSNVYYVYDTQGAPIDPAFKSYNEQGMESNSATKRKESLHSINRPRWFQDDNLPTKFPFARHPTVDKHTFEQRFQSGPGAYSPFQRKEDLTKRPDELYSDLNGSLRPPPTYIQSHALPLDRQYNGPQQRRRTNRPHRKRPSLLKNFGFFKRRSGVSGPSSDVNSLRTSDSEKESSKYLLTKGPIPYNAQKVTVIGPFKTPPIGAPKVLPLHMPVQGDSLLPMMPSTKLNPPSPFLSPSLSNEIDILNREPSFKVINLPKEDGLTINQGYTVPTNVKSGITNDQKGTSDKNIEKSSIIYGQKNIFTNPKFIDSNSTIVDVSSNFNVGNEKIDRMAIISQALSSAHNEVSEADKERIIAAKFVFPRAQAVRRSGFDSHVIPIPVPLLGTSGNQIHQMQRIILPKLPIKRSILPEPQRKEPRRVDIDPLLHGSQVPGTNPNSNGFFSPDTDSKISMTSKTHDHDSSVSEFQNKGINPSIFREGNVKAVAEKGQAVLKEVFATPAQQIKYPMKITPYPTSSSFNEKFFEQPQSFVEPTNPAIMYGDWKVVGESKVDPKGELDPVVSFVVENTPEIILKTPEKDENDKQEPSKKLNENVLIVNAPEKKGIIENELEVEEIVMGTRKEDKMVKVSSMLNIEGPDDSMESFLVQPPKVN